MSDQNPAEQRDSIRWERIFVAAALAYCIAKFALLSVYAVHIQYVMDEYWQGGESYRIPEFYRSYDPVKTVLYAYFYNFARLVTNTSSELMRAARIQTLVLVAGMLFLLWRTWRNISFSRREALFGLCVLLTYSNFMERSFRVRSDSVALFFDVAAVAFACSGSLTSRRRAFVVGVLVGLAFLSTQKAAYAAFAIGVAMSVAVFLEAGFRRWITVGLSCLAGFSVDLGLYATAFRGRGFESILQPVFSRPLDIVQNAAAYYPDMNRFITQTLYRNWLPYTLCFVGLTVSAAAWRSASPQRRFAIVFTAVFSSLVFVHNQPWPYLFVGAIVFLAPWSAEIPGLIARLLPRHAALGEFLLLCFLSLSLARNVSYLEQDNVIQETVSDYAEALLGPEDSYEDGLGMITTRELAAAAWWDWMGITRLLEATSRGDSVQLDRVFAAQPKLWILNYRIAGLQPVLGSMLNRSYIRVHRNVLLAGCELRETHTIFINRWEGTFSVYGQSGSVDGVPIIINGVSTNTPVDLAVGRYAIRSGSPSPHPLFLLPAELALKSVKPVELPPIELFRWVYD